MFRQRQSKPYLTRKRRKEYMQWFDGFKDRPRRTTRKYDRSKMTSIQASLTARKFTCSQPYIGWIGRKKRLGAEIDRRRFRSKRNTVRASKLVGGVVPSRKCGKSLTDLEFAHLSPGSRPASRTARLRDERPCARSLVSARDATRCQILPEDRVLRMLPANGRLCTRLPGPPWLFDDVSVSEWNERWLETRPMEARLVGEFWFMVHRSTTFNGYFRVEYFYCRRQAINIVVVLRGKLFYHPLSMKHRCFDKLRVCREWIFLTRYLSIREDRLSVNYDVCSSTGHWLNNGTSYLTYWNTDIEKSRSVS